MSIKSRTKNYGGPVHGGRGREFFYIVINYLRDTRWITRISTTSSFFFFDKGKKNCWEFIKIHIKYFGGSIILGGGEVKFLNSWKIPKITYWEEREDAQHVSYWSDEYTYIHTYIYVYRLYMLYIVCVSIINPAIYRGNT